MSAPSASRLPSLFVSHGSPLFALDPGIAGSELRALAGRLPRPEAIVIASPHWMTAQLSVTSAARPGTLHDFGGFPQALYALQYPAPGSPVWAQRVLEALGDAGIAARADPRRGLDHGAWVPLLHMYPAADIPVIQLSLHPHFGPAHHLQLGRALAPLRDRGALLIGSGSLTHNLYELRREPGPVRDYVSAFAGWIAATLAAGDTAALLDYRTRAPFAEHAHPTDEHLLPLLFAVGAAGEAWQAERIAGDDVRYGTLAMDSYVLRAPA